MEYNFMPKDKRPAPPSTLKKAGTLVKGLYNDVKSKVKKAGSNMGAGATKYNDERLSAAEEGRKMNFKKKK